MKKLVSITLALIIAISAAVSTSAFIISDRYATIYYGNSTQLTLDKELVPSNVAFSSSDERIAKVSEDGTVSTVSPGNCIITAVNTRNGETDECEIHVQLLWWKMFENLMTYLKNLFVK